MHRKSHAFFALFLGLGLVLGLLFWLNPTSAIAQSTPQPTQVIQGGLTYLQNQQQADGGILGFSGASDPDTTARSVLAISLNGLKVSDVITAEGKSTLDYLSAEAITYTHDTAGTLFPGRAGLLLAAVSVVGINPTDFGGMDLAGELEASYQPDTGAYNTTAKQDMSNGSASDLSQAWAILGLSLAGHSIPDEATQYLIHSQAADGSWGNGDPDTTALVVTALLTSRIVDVQSTTIQQAMKYFHSTQADSGGWKPSWDTDPLNADSTGWILQALATAGEDPTSQSWTVNGVNPVQALLALQKPDGSIGGTYANTYSTAEALIGLAGVPLSSLGQAPISHRAGLAIFYGDNSYFTGCITFTESTISGIDLLERSGLAVETATNPNQGTAVCKIAKVGCPSSDCFCSMPKYWSFWQAGANGFEYSAVGVGQSQVHDGSVHAWTWGEGNPPPDVTFRNICEGVPFVIPAATLTSAPPTDTPEPTLQASLIPASPTIQTTPVTHRSETNAGTYLVYASILAVVVGLILYLVRSRSR